MDHISVKNVSILDGYSLIGYLSKGIRVNRNGMLIELHKLIIQFMSGFPRQLYTTETYIFLSLFQINVNFHIVGRWVIFIYFSDTGGVYFTIMIKYLLLNNIIYKISLVETHNSCV